MILTDGVTSIGPHPATRTELEARAEGHYAGKVELQFSTADILTEDGTHLLEVSGSSGDQREWRANAAFAYLAWTSYAPMKEALEAVLPFLTRNYPTSGHIDTICAALSAARGNTRKE